MPLPLTVARPQPLAVAPAVGAAAVLAIGAGLVWLRNQLARKHFRESVFMNDYQTDALYRRPDYRGMSGDQINRARQLLDQVGEDSYLMQPGSVLLERRGLDAEMLRRSGGGGFLFIAPGGPSEFSASELTVAGAAALVGAGAELWAQAVKGGGALRNGLTQLWGYLNRPPEWITPQDWSSAVDPYTVAFASPGQLTITYKNRRQTTFTSSQYDWGPPTNTVSGVLTYSRAGVEAFELTPFANVGGTFVGGLITGPASGIRVKVGGVWQNFEAWSSIGAIGNGGITTVVTGSVSSEVLTATHGTQTIPPPPIQASTPLPRDLAPDIAQPVPTPAYVPSGVPEPGTSPVPGAVPVTQPQPTAVPAGTPSVRPGGRASAPITVPTVAPTPAYVPRTPPATTRPLTNGGTLPQPEPVPVPLTPGSTVIPWPGAKPIDPEPLAPPPTIEGIAKKTGELEGKLDQIGGMLQPPDVDFDWGTVFQVLAQLANWLSSADPEGSYEISSPCVATGEGSAAQPLSAGWAASIGGDQRIIKRLDALAELLQHHKTLKQPSCKGPTPQGEVVTVQFEET